MTSGRYVLTAILWSYGYLNIYMFDTDAPISLPLDECSKFTEYHLADGQAVKNMLSAVLTSFFSLSGDGIPDEAFPPEPDDQDG